MSNDNKTLAGVQPGGRVRLGDQAERARFEEFLSRNPLTALCAGTAWEVWQAALSAQPSPGGQVDALVALVSKWRNEASAYDDQQAKETGYEVDWTYDAKARALDRAADELEAALAARQPVYVQGCDELRARTESERAAYMEGLDEGKKIAARQPVGEPDEPIFQVKHHDDTEATWRDATEAAYEMQPAALRRIVYAAPTEQAVDLGQFRPAVCAMGLYAEEPEDVDEAKRLMALIDKAVGK